MDKNHHFVCLQNRRLIIIRGEEAEHFLHTIITTDVTALEKQTLRPGALLSPQGKVMFDFLIGRLDDGFLIDIAAPLAPPFIKRLGLYKLRAKAEIIESDESLIAVSFDGDSSSSSDDSTFADLRFPLSRKVLRHYGKAAQKANHDETAWTRLRIENSIAESGQDFIANDVFPHDIAYDQIGGISFKKGCYIGQEVVSRMHHRSTARRRPLVAHSASPMPPSGTPIEANGKVLGTIGSVVGHDGLALVRIDRVKQAMDHNIPITAAAVELELSIAANMSFNFPDQTDEAE